MQAYNQPNWVPGKSSTEKLTSPKTQLPKSTKKITTKNSQENKENKPEKRTSDSQIINIDDDSTSSPIANPSKKMNQNNA